MPRLVLVVEAETVLGDSIRVYLERQAYATFVARSGEEALRFAETTSPDVAVMDIRLPGMDGLEVLRNLRDLSPGTEVVMMTAHASVASAVEAMRRGAFDTEALQVAGWNRGRAARLLGISKETLRYRIEKHQIQATL